jgi:RND family efflux transporter MFP subunit
MHRPQPVGHHKLYYVYTLSRLFPLRVRNIFRSRALKFALTVCLASFILAGCQQKAAISPGGPPEVSVVAVIQKDIPLTSDWVASLDGYVNAQIQPQVSGYLIRQNYREGSFVHKDDVLFEIDPRPFQAVLDQVKGQLAQARAQVRQAEGKLAQDQAQLVLAQINVKRDTPLADARAIPHSQLDTEVQTQSTVEALLKTDQAGIVSAEAAIESAEANVRAAELNLGFTKVLSLVDGVAGLATVQIGNLVSPTAVLTTVSQVDPIKAYFPISEQEYLAVSDPGKGDWLKAAAAVPLQLRLADGSVYPRPGRIVFTDRQVDTSTGTIRVVGAFANPGNILRPGQFGRVMATTGTRRGALLVPQRAITELQGRYQAAIVGTDNKVTIRNVTPGRRIGSMWIVESGLSPGDRVVIEGLAKAQDGATVRPKLEPSDLKQTESAQTSE